ncbi:MAG: discoidin domain-containing protein, partial [Betaproteobacteria bacterium]|nr:discoidin domain-containing protein [Betaproteobacteria bacterium]
ATVSENFVYLKTGLDPAQPHTIKIVVKGARHPKSKGNAIGHMAFEFAAESYRASAGFSSIMGKNNWRYLQRAGEAEKRLQFLPSDEVFTRDWQGEGAVRIGNNYQIPDAGHEAVRQWVAPHAGTVRIEGEVTHDPPGGTSARLLKGKEVLWSAGSGSSASPVRHDLKIEVAQGEKIDFVAAAIKDGTGKVSWDPVITYTRSEPAVFRPNPPSDENLALGKYARSKMLSFAAQPFHAVDGDVRTAFSIYPDDRIASGDDWLQVDLDRPQTMDRYVLVSAPPVKDWRPASFTLQRSDDGFAWTDVDKVTDNQEERCERKVPAFTARYVRIYLPKGKPFTLQELELYRDGGSLWKARIMNFLKRVFRKEPGKDG